MALGNALDGEREHLLVDEAVPVMDLDRLPDEHDRHVRADDLVVADDHEVHVRHRLRHRVTLHLAGEGQEGTRTGVERQELVQPRLARERGT